MRVAATVLHAGSADAEVLALGAPISFWGGFDPSTGTIIDTTHPQVGEVLTHKVVVMGGSRGSSGTPGVLAESIRLGTGPSALVVTKADINLMAGAIIAGELYGIHCAVLLVSLEDQAAIGSRPRAKISHDGMVT